MRLRAAFALLFQLLLLQVSVLGGGMACAPEWLGTVAGTRAVAAVETHGSHAAHAAPTQDSAPDHGGAPSHCAAAASCAAVTVEAPEVTAASVADVHASVQIGRVSLPPSTHQAPEPPPPRA